jgi:hypothetical protein
MANTNRSAKSLEGRILSEIARLEKRPFPLKRYAAGILTGTLLAGIVGTAYFLGNSGLLPLEKPVQSVQTPEEQSLVYIGREIARQAQYSTEHVNLEPGDVLLVSTTQFKADDIECIGKSLEVCVYIKEAETQATVTLENIIPEQTWIAVGDHSSLDEVYRSRLPAYRNSPNCGTGCKMAKIHLDSHRDGKMTIYMDEELPAFYMLSLEEISRGTPQYVDLEMDRSITQFGDIWFDNRYGTVTQCQDELRTQPETLGFDVDIPNVSSVQLLMQGGHGFYTLDGLEFGYIRLNFGDGEELTKKLVMGESIRDWARDRGTAVTTLTDPFVTEVWRGYVSARSPNEAGLIAGLDMMTIEVPQGYGNLSRITVADTSRDLGGLNPCIQLYGVSVTAR